jgi:hypothetical protein
MVQTLFNGNNLEAWSPRTGKSHAWQVVRGVALSDTDPRLFAVETGTGVFYNGPDGNTSDIFTDAEFGDCRLHVEFCVPKDSNSGVYLMGRYEVQILDSWGKQELTFSTCSGIYARWIDGKHFEGNPPKVNSSKPPGEWQSFDITFRAPKFLAEGEKVENARFVEVVWNGTIVQSDVEVSGPTRAAMFEDEAPHGPLMLQGDHGPVAYRNLTLEPL